MKSDQGAHLLGESATAHRILAIDDEIAALDRVHPKSRYLWYGTLLLAMFLLWAVTLVVAGSAAAEPLLRVTILVAIPSAVFGAQLIRNRRRRHRLELELDELIEAPAPNGLALRPLEGSAPPPTDQIS